MATDIYKIVKGEKVYLSDREVKAYIMEQRGWTSEQYSKEYDKLRNRVKNYEAFQRAHGVSPKTQSARDILYKETKAMARHGADYKPTEQLQRLKSFPSYSTGKAFKKVLASEAKNVRLAAQYKEAVLKRFDRFISQNPMAKKISEEISDPVKMEQALTDFANKLHEAIDESIEAQKKAAIPFGDTVGSKDELNDFDISQYL